MKKAIKKSLYGLVGAASLLQVGVGNAAMTLGLDGVQDGLKGSTESIDQSVQSMAVKAMTYISILAVIYGLWGGFNILTAAGDEEKVKKGKTIIMHTVIGLIVIWLVGSIVAWVVSSLLETA